MSDLSKLLNTPIPISFKTGDTTVEFQFHELTLLEHSTWIRKLEAKAREEWLARLKSIAQLLTDKIEQRKMLAEASQHEPDLAEAVNRLARSVEGTRWLVQAGAIPALTDEVYGKIDADMTNADPITRAVRIVLGLPDKEEKADTSAPANPPTPPPVPSAAN